MNQNPPPLAGASSTPPKNSGLAITSMVLGILSITCLSIVAGVPAVICGHIAKCRIKRSLGALTGGGFALAGLIMGYISIALAIFVIPMMLAIALPNFVKAKETAQRNQCINNLRHLDSAIQQWALENKKRPDESVNLTELQAYLRGPLVCPAGGTTFADSYSLGAAANPPVCIAPNGGKEHGHELAQ